MRGSRSIVTLLALVLCTACFSNKSGKRSKRIRASVSAVTAIPRTGLVHASGKSLRDDQGEFHALGATMMWALWGFKNDRAGLERELSYLAENGFHFIRALGTIGPNPDVRQGDYWSQRWMTSAWSDYDQMIQGLTDLAYDKYGLRVEWTVFGGAYGYSESQIQGLIDRFLAMSRGREQKIIHFEIGNESWQTGFDGNKGTSMLRRMSRYMKDRTDILVAASAPANTECENVKEYYDGDVADIATLHFDRDLREDGWRPVRQPWSYHHEMGCFNGPKIASNNEPIGTPGAGSNSVPTESDPYRLAAGAYVSFISGIPLHVYHTDEGIRGFKPLKDAPGSWAFRHIGSLLPANIANWSPFHTGRSETPFGADLIWPEGNHSSGIVRAYGAASGGQFVMLPMGIKRQVRLDARRDLEFTAYDPVTGESKGQGCLKSGQTLTLSGLSVFLLKGSFTSACASTGNISVGGSPSTTPSMGPVGTPQNETPSGSGCFPKLSASNSRDAMIEVAGHVRNRHPEFFTSDNRGTAYDMMGVVNNILRANGYDARRALSNFSLPKSDPFRWGSDHVVLGGTVYDVYSSWPSPAIPQASEHGSQPGEITSDLIPMSHGLGCGTTTTLPPLSTTPTTLPGNSDLSAVCNPETQPWPHWGVKNGSCLPSCGVLAGETASAPSTACQLNGLFDAGQAYDAPYCCSPTAVMPPSPPPASSGSSTRKLKIAMISNQGGSTGMVNFGGQSCDEGVCEFDFPMGSSQTLSATSQAGIRFVEFTDGGNPCGISTSGESITMDRDRDCLAIFTNDSSASGSSSSCNDEGSYTGRGYPTQSYCQHTYRYVPNVTCSFSSGCWRPNL